MPRSAELQFAVTGDPPRQHAPRSSERWPDPNRRRGQQAGGNTRPETECQIGRAQERISGGGRAGGAHLGSGAAAGHAERISREAAPIGAKGEGITRDPLFPFLSLLPCSLSPRLSPGPGLAVFSWARQNRVNVKRGERQERVRGLLERETWLSVCRRAGARRGSSSLSWL